MKSIIINLEKAPDVQKFVNITQNRVAKIICRSGEYVVDGKSILGVFSLDLAKPIQVEITGDDADAVLNELAIFQA